jgi:hypothetical protein
VNRDKPKPPTAAPPTPTAAPKRDTVANNMTGRVTHDDRGNAVWEWAMSTGKLGGDAAVQRLKKLDHLSLALTDDPPPQATVQQNPLGTVKGYSPYDSGVLEKKAAPRKKDLRKLSEWLALKKQAEKNKQR